MSDNVNDSTLRRLVRFSDALRDATQNPQTFGITPDELETLLRLVERIDHRIAQARRI
jgi:hypothetical protein